MKTKKIFQVILSALLCATMMFGMVACSGDSSKDGDDKVYNIVVWVSESAGVKELTEQQIAAFNKIEGHGYTINATIEGVTESDSATKMITDVESGADIFCFAQDQTARLVQAGALAQPGVKATETIKELNDAGAVKAATIGDNVMCYPLTSDNGYFLIYDKRVISEEQTKDLATLVKACEDAGKNFSMEVETSAWYLASFFFGVGCHSDWEINADGKATGISDNFNSDIGLIALKGMQQLVKSDCHVSSSNAADFAAATPSAVVVSGTWALEAAKQAIGEENLGYSELPSFTVDGKTYHMGSFSGNKLMGVKPQSDSEKAKALSDLALYLTNEACQMQRFENFGWGPSNLAAQESDAVKSNAPLAALAAQNNYATPQGQIDGGWWDIAKVIGTGAKEAAVGDEAALKAALEQYDASLQGIINKTDDEAKMWTVIGGIMGSSWDYDFSMTERPAGTWTSIPLYMAAEESFKARMGKSWDTNIGGNTAENTNDDGNYVITESGLYMVTLSSTEQVISLIPTTFGVIGSINDWNGDIAMTKVEGEIAYATEKIDLPANAEIKVRYNGSWDYGDVGAAEGGNYVVENAGSYSVKISWDGAAHAWVISLTE